MQLRDKRKLPDKMPFCHKMTVLPHKNRHNVLIKILITFGIQFDHSKVTLIVKLNRREKMTLVTLKNRDLFNDLFNSIESKSLDNKGFPKVNILESDKDYIIELAAPGMKKGEFNIELDKNVLTISSKGKEDKKEENKQYQKIEFNYQAFARSFTLPERADSENIAANYKDGILNISIPKKERAKATIKVA